MDRSLAGCICFLGHGAGGAYKTTLKFLLELEGMDR